MFFHAINHPDSKKNWPTGHFYNKAHTAFSHIFRIHHTVSISFLGLLNTVLANPLYPIYMENWYISTMAIGYAFITYMVDVVFSLLFSNDLSAKYSY